PDPRVPALARYLAGALGALPADVQVLFLGLRGGLHRAWLPRVEPAGGLVRVLRPPVHPLLLRLLPDHPAGAGAGRKHQAAAQLDRRFDRAGQSMSGGRNTMRIQRKLLAQGLLAVLIAGAVAAATNPAAAQETEAATPPKLSWSFAGPFGTYDQAQLQRGL